MMQDDGGKNDKPTITYIYDDNDARAPTGLESKIWADQAITDLISTLLGGVSAGLLTKWCKDPEQEHKFVRCPDNNVQEFMRSRGAAVADVPEIQKEGEAAQSGGGLGEGAVEFVKAAANTGIAVSGKMIDTLLPTFIAAASGKYADTPWEEAAPEFQEYLHKQIELMEKVSSDPKNMELIRKWAEEKTKIGQEYLLILEPNMDLLIQKYWEFLSKMLDKSASGVANTGMNLTEAVVGEIPVVGGIFALFMAFLRGVNAAMHAAAPGVEGATMGVGVMARTGSQLANVGAEGKAEGAGKSLGARMKQHLLAAATKGLDAAVGTLAKRPPPNWSPPQAGGAESPQGGETGPEQAWNKMEKAERVGIWKTYMKEHRPPGKGGELEGVGESWEPGTSDAKKHMIWGKWAASSGFQNMKANMSKGLSGLKGKMTDGLAARKGRAAKAKAMEEIKADKVPPQWKGQLKYGSHMIPGMVKRHWKKLPTEPSPEREDSKILNLSPGCEKNVNECESKLDAWIKADQNQQEKERKEADARTEKYAKKAKQAAALGASGARMTARMTARAAGLGGGTRKNLEKRINRTTRRLRRSIERFTRKRRDRGNGARRTRRSR